MAYWGEALTYTHPIWMQQDLDAARAVLKQMPPAKTQRERDHIHTIEVLYGEGELTESPPPRQKASSEEWTSVRND